MESLTENRPLLWSIALSGLAIVGLLTGSSPEFNEQFALVDIPTEVRICGSAYTRRPLQSPVSFWSSMQIRERFSYMRTYVHENHARSDY